MGRALMLVSALLGLLALDAIQPAAGRAEFAVTEFSATSSSTEAGMHPDVTIGFKFRETANPVADGDVRDMVFQMPTGFMGNPTVVHKCTTVEFVTYFESGGTSSGCPAASQIGTARLRILFLFPESSQPSTLVSPVFLLEPTNAEETARLGLFVGGSVRIPVTISVDVRTADPTDYGLTARLRGISRYSGFRLAAASMTLWGVPADPVHDPERYTQGGFQIGVGTPTLRPNPGLPRMPFLSNPTSCGRNANVTMIADSYQMPGAFLGPFVASLSGPLGMTGCDSLPFSPGLEVRSDGREAATPTGYSVQVELPQNVAPDAPATAHLRRTVVTFPPGMVISPPSADGLGTCADAELKLGTEVPAACPESSKIGSVEVETPNMPGRLHGGIYLRTPTPGQLFRLALVVGGFGVEAKLAGVATPDPATGQITAVFDDTPQVPFERLRVRLKGGSRAPLRSPSVCGTHRAEFSFSPWSESRSVVGTTPIVVDRACDIARFGPRLRAGVTRAIAGRFSPFVLTLTRRDREENVARVDVEMPRGLLASLKDVPLCPSSLAPSGSCPPGSAVGSVTVAVGSGPAPLWVPESGRAPAPVYLSGPYGDAPYSLVFVVPGQVGPFDLGTVVTRAAVYVNPRTARLTVRSDPLPQILAGVPLTYRTIHVDIDRSRFVTNPTSCRSSHVNGTITSPQLSLAAANPVFQVAGCRDLPFRPRLGLRLTGRTQRGGNPGLRAVLAMPRGDANVSRAAVTLPPATILDQSHIRTVCTRAQFAARRCPEGARYGSARAWSPLLNEPLRGPVYLRSSDHLLPDLVADLRGEVDLELVGRIDSVRGGIRTVFDAVPDAAVSKFVLSMRGGRRGLIQNSVRLCRARLRARVNLRGHNDAVRRARLTLRTGCGHRGRVSHRRHR